ncbi:MAG: hypothetical protein NZ903_01980 [Candidatus Micrarchaeota archaeon]|nr:hypothetical protein [Candidatus Micrarchaeota archaeon]
MRTGFLLAFSLLISLIYAQASGEITIRLVQSLNNLCVQMTQILPIIAIVLFVLAALVYGIGHVFGAEMKTKAIGWATSMVVGAIISILIFLLAKPILGIFVPEMATTDFCSEGFSH